MALNDIEWQSLPLVAEWHLMAKIIKSRPVIKQSQAALPLYAIKGAARMPFQSVGKNESPPKWEGFALSKSNHEGTTSSYSF